jgi:hypothetical protein
LIIRGENEEEGKSHAEMGTELKTNRKGAASSLVLDLSLFLKESTSVCD